MDVAAMSIAMSQVKLQQNVGIAMMKQVMDTAEQSTDLLMKVMGDTGALEHSVQPHLGANIDIKL